MAASLPAVPAWLGTASFAVLGAALGYLAYKLVRLALADADLHLLGLGKHRANAFEGKVIWITGASQVGRW